MREQRYIRRVDSRHVLVWTEGMARKPDFVECDREGRTLKGAVPGVPEKLPMTPEEAKAALGVDVLIGSSGGGLIP